MKKILLVFTCLFVAKNTNAQSWNLTLNAISGSPNFGTSSNHPINFFTNGTQRMTLSTTGALRINGLAGTGNRFLQADANGNLVAWTGSGLDANKVLYGDGAWRSNPFSYDGSNVATGSGIKLGVGVSSPLVELDVAGKGKFSSDLTVGGVIFSSDNSKREVIPASGSNPLIFKQTPNKSPGASPTFPAYSYKAPCNVFFADPLQYDLQGNPFLTAWAPPTSNIDYDLYQIYESNAQNSVINLGILNGDAILSVEPIPFSGTTPKLKINPSCGGDVFICEGGGFTKMFGDASVGGSLRVGPGNSVSGAMFDMYLDVSSSKAFSIIDPALTSTNKAVFEVSKTGRAVFGIDIQTINGSMVTIGQSNKTAPALSILDNSTSTSLPIFNVLGNGFTEIYSTAAKAFSIKNANSSNLETFDINSNGYTEIKTTNTRAFSIYNQNNGNNETFAIDANGYTQINVYSPTGMPVPPYGTSTWPITNPRVITVRDMTFNSNAGRDLFVVRADGTVFAREIEINNGDNFPDYVFDKDYKLLSVKEVADFIEKNKHLPGFEKAEHYEKNGIAVNSLLIKQQEKIEELTLYIIAQEKKFEEQDMQIQDQEKRLQLLESKK